MQVSQLLLKTLEDLGGDDFETFKWNLREGSAGDAIPVSRLESAPRRGTVSEMIQRYGEESAVNITAEILRTMGKNNDAEKLKKAYAEGRAPAAAPPAAAPPAAVAAAPAAPPAAAAAAPAAVSAQGGSVVFAPTVTGSGTGTWNITINK